MSSSGVAAHQSARKMILVAGPYRSGTGDDPAKMAANLDAIRRASLVLFRAGHLPVNGEDLAIPLVALAGSSRVGDDVFDEIFHPVGRRLVVRCNAVLRLPGESVGADEMVDLGRAAGAEIFYDVDEIAPCV